VSSEEGKKKIEKLKEDPKELVPSSHNIAFCFKVYLNDIVQLLSD